MFLGYRRTYLEKNQGPDWNLYAQVAVADPWFLGQVPREGKSLSVPTESDSGKFKPSLIKIKTWREVSVPIPVKFFSHY